MEHLSSDRRTLTRLSATASEDIANLEPGRALLRKVMAVLRERYDLNLAEWSRQNGERYPIVRTALVGATVNENAKRIVQKVKRAVLLPPEGDPQCGVGRAGGR